jgi:hypothetical protein
MGDATWIAEIIDGFDALLEYSLEHPMNESRYPCFDAEVKRMQEAYALAQHTLHVGDSGTYTFYCWGKHYEIAVKDGKLTTQRVSKS